MAIIVVGNSVPSFKLKDQLGELFSLDSVLGKKKLVICYYPKDDSPGCTMQSWLFRDQFEVFADADDLIIGSISQSVKSHYVFARQHRLNYTLLRNEGNKICKLFGVPGNFLACYLAGLHR